MSRIHGQMSPEYYNALQRAVAFPLTEEEKRRKAMEFQAEALKSVTRYEHAQLYGVTPAAETLYPATKGVRAGAEAPPAGSKNRGFFRGGPRP